MQVEWKPIFNGEFEVSSDGRIRRVFKTHHNQKLGEISINRSGRYSKCHLVVAGQKRQFSVHRLILLGFRGPCPAGLQSGHLNGKSHDNRIENLKYITHAENQRHRILHGTQARGERQGASKLTEADVKSIRTRLAANAASINGIAREYGMAPQTIWAVKERLTWTHI